jgi:hypothetical protein
MVARQGPTVVVSPASEVASRPTSTSAVCICDRRHNLNKLLHILGPSLTFDILNPHFIR